MLSVVLSRRDLREYDQIISLYTRDGGKREVLATGIKKITSRNAALVEPCSLLDVEIAPGKEIDHLGSVQPINLFKNIRADLARLAVAGYAVALVDDLTSPGEADARLFNMLASWLSFVDGSPAVNLLLVAGFVAKLFGALGFSLAGERSKTLPAVSAALDTLVNGDWFVIQAMKFDPKQVGALDGLVYDFACRHSEKKLPDWRRIARLV